MAHISRATYVASYMTNVHVLVCYVGANPLYSVQWFLLNQSSLVFVCTLACRTSIIRGCKVTLSQEQRTVSNEADELMETSNELSGNTVNIIFTELESNISFNNPFMYSASAIASDGIVEFGQQLDGIAIISGDLNCKYVAMYT